MNHEIIYNQLSGLLEAIQEQYDAIRLTEGRIPQIEIDILLDNTRKLYDQLQLLQKLNTTPSPVQTGHAPSLPPQPPSPIKSIERPKPEIRKEEQAAKTPIASDLDLFAEEEPTFSMRLKEAREQTLPSKAEHVEHLKQLISINDKFIFINELFDGNLKEYNEAIETLNGFEVKNEAFNYLDLLRTKNLWDLESGTLMKLKEIVERKYA